MGVVYFDTGTITMLNDTQYSSAVNVIEAEYADLVGGVPHQAPNVIDPEDHEIPKPIPQGASLDEILDDAAVVEPDVVRAGSDTDDWRFHDVRQWSLRNSPQLRNVFLREVSIVPLTSSCPIDVVIVSFPDFHRGEHLYITETLPLDPNKVHVARDMIPIVTDLRSQVFSDADAATALYARTNPFTKLMNVYLGHMRSKSSVFNIEINTLTTLPSSTVPADGIEFKMIFMLEYN